MSCPTAGNVSPITLGSAVPGFLLFDDAGVPNGANISYGIMDGVNSEIGEGVYTTAGKTLTRNVTKSTAAGSRITLSGNAQVFICVRAEDVVNKAGDTMTGNLTVPAGTAASPAIQFTGGGTNTGFYATASSVNISVGGSNRYLLGSSATINASIRGADGTQAAPEYSFLSESSSGIFRKGAGSVSLSATNTEVMNWNVTGKTVTVFGPLMLAANPSATLEASSKSYVDNGDAALQINIDAKAATTYVDSQDTAIYNALNGNKVNKAGDTMTNGLSFGSNIAPGGALDVSRHLALYSSTYGINVTSNTMNLVANGAATVNITSAGVTINGTLTTPGGGINTNGISCTTITTPQLNMGSTSLTESFTEWGSRTVATPVYFDFHSSGTNSDYDVRVVYNGGNAGSGQGNVTFEAAGGLSCTGSLTCNAINTRGNRIDCGPIGSGAVTCTSINTQGNQIDSGTINAGAINMSGALTLQTWRDYGLIYFGNQGNKYLEQNGAEVNWVNVNFHIPQGNMSCGGAFTAGGDINTGTYSNMHCWIAYCEAISCVEWCNVGTLSCGGQMHADWVSTNGGVNCGGELATGSGDYGVQRLGNPGAGRYWVQNGGKLELAGIDDLRLYTSIYCNQSISIEGQGYKPNGGLWGDISDARIKNVLGDYESGLKEILCLRPRMYSFKGNDSLEPSSKSRHELSAKEQKKFIGLVAQECEEAMPEMVSDIEGYIDGEKVNDLRELDTSPLIYALVNAVKELAIRVETIEAKLKH
jgi:hypothetical protein